MWSKWHTSGRRLVKSSSLVVQLQRIKALSLTRKLVRGTLKSPRELERKRVSHHHKHCPLLLLSLSLTLSSLHIILDYLRLVILVEFPYEAHYVILVLEMLAVRCFEFVIYWWMRRSSWQEAICSMKLMRLGTRSINILSAPAHRARRRLFDIYRCIVLIPYRIVIGRKCMRDLRQNEASSIIISSAAASIKRN